MSYIVCIYDYGGLIFIVNKMFCLSFMAITNRKFSPDVTQQIKKSTPIGCFFDWLRYMDCARAIARCTPKGAFSVHVCHKYGKHESKTLIMVLTRCISANKKNTPARGVFLFGCATWIRTTINGVRVRCPTIRR